MKTIKNILLPVLFALLASCAVKYHAVDPQSAGFKTIQNPKNVQILCSEMNLLGSSNKKLRQSLERNQLIFVPIQVINNSTKPFDIDLHSVEMINDFQPAQIVLKEDYENLKVQSVWANMLYAPAVLGASYYRETGVVGTTTFERRGFRLNAVSIAIGAWALVNTARTIINNKKAIRNMTTYDLMNTTIPPGTTRYGFICIKGEKLNQPMVRID